MHTGDAGGYNFSGDGGKPEEWKTILTTGNLFEVMGSPLTIGAPWPQLQDRERDYRVILTYNVWQRAFGGRRDIVGKTITLDPAVPRAAPISRVRPDRRQRKSLMIYSVG
jgi:hypothetical protein